MQQTLVAEVIRQKAFLDESRNQRCEILGRLLGHRVDGLLYGEWLNATNHFVVPLDEAGMPLDQLRVDEQLGDDVAEEARSQTVIGRQGLSKSHGQVGSDFGERSRLMKPAVVVEMLPRSGRHFGWGRAVVEQERLDERRADADFTIRDR